MKFYIVAGLAGLLLFASTARAQTPPEMPAPFNPLIVDETETVDRALGFGDDADANLQSKDVYIDTLYEECRAAPSNILNPGEQDMLCACMAANTYEGMSAQELHVMSTPTPEGKTQRERLFGGFYMPCFSYAVNDLVRESCLANEDTASALKKPVQVCGCVGNLMSTYSKSKYEYVVRNAWLKPQEKGTMDAVIDSLLFSRDAQRMMKAYIKRCVRKHELGW